MSIVRVTKRHRFVVIDKTGIEDPHLGLRSTGLLAFLLAKPDDWTITYRDLAGKKGTDLEHSVRMALKELETFGYLKRERRRTPDGKWHWEHVLYECPDCPEEPGEISATMLEKSTHGVISTNGEAHALKTMPRKSRHITEEPTEEPKEQNQELELVLPARTKAQKIAERHIERLKPLVASGSGFDLSREVRLIYGDAWREAVVHGVSPVAVAQDVLARFWLTVTAIDPPYALLRKLVAEFGELAVDGVAEAIGHDTEAAGNGWYPYARRVCQRLHKDALVEQRGGDA